MFPFAVIFIIAPQFPDNVAYLITIPFHGEPR